MIRINLICLMLLLVIQNLVKAQDKRTIPQYTALKPGDQVPSYELKNLINYPSTTLNLNDFKGKVLILDFWGTYCSSCIASWPKLMALQKQFSDQLQILLINPTQGADLIKPLILQQKKIRNIDLQLPIAYKDSTIKQLFPFKTVPHVVWIDQTGKLQYITTSEFLNTDNIKMMISGKSPKMQQKTDYSIQADYSKPLFVNGNGGLGTELLWHSSLSGFSQGLSPTYGMKTSKDQPAVIFISNHPIADIYRYAYSNHFNRDGILGKIVPSRLQIQSKDSVKYLGFKHGQQQIENWYSYQLIAPKGDRKDLQNIMQQDLSRYFGLKVTKQIREMMCLVLRASDTTRIAYKEGKFRLSIEDTGIELNKVTTDQFITTLEDQQYYSSSYPIINETGFQGKLGSIKFEADVKDFRALNHALSPYKMSFTLAKRPVEILVLNDPEPILF